MQPDPVPDFLAAMEACGVRPVEPIANRLGDGFIRFRCEGDGRGKRNGWAVLHLDGVPAGRFGNFRLNVDQRWRSDQVVALSPSERRELAARVRRQAAEREAAKAAMWDRVADWAGKEWAGAKPADPAHPYLVRKRITGEGLRQSGADLLVPMRDDAGKLWNLQRIRPDGFKLFGPPGCGLGNGGRQEGLFWLCGEPDAALGVGEGVATMAAVRRATGLAVAASFNGGNLLVVGKALRGLYPDLDLIFCADDDRALVDHPQIKRNLGIEYARAAALAVAGRVAVPPSGEYQ